MRPLTPREGKLVAVALLVALVAGAWALVIAPIAGGFSARTLARRELLDRYRRNQDLVAAAPVLRAEAAAQRRSAPRFALIAASPAAAVEALRTRLAATLAQDGGPGSNPGANPVASIEAVQGGLPPGWVGVRADAALSLTRFVAAVRRLENEEPYVVVDYASLRTDAAATDASGGANAGTTLGAVFPAGPAAVPGTVPGTLPGALPGARPGALNAGRGAYGLAAAGPLQVRLQISAPVRAAPPR